MRTLAIVLVVIGLIGLLWGGVSYIKDRDTADLGAVEISVTEKDRVSIPPVVGAACLVGGLALLVMGSRRR